MATISTRRDAAADPMHLLDEIAEAASLSYAERTWSLFNRSQSHRVLVHSRRLDLSGRIRRLLETIAANRVLRGPVAAGLLAEVHNYLLKLDPGDEEPRQDDGEAAEGQDIDPATGDAS